jgi:hypothetical protein
MSLNSMASEITRMVQDGPSTAVVDGRMVWRRMRSHPSLLPTEYLLASIPEWKLSALGNSSQIQLQVFHSRNL